MITLTPAEARAVVATRVAAVLTDYREAAEPLMFLRANLRSMAPGTFVVGRGRAEPVGTRQRVDEGVPTQTAITVMVALQAQAGAHLDIEDTTGTVCQSLRVALCADWSPDLALVWAGDPEPVATETLVRCECQFIAIHQTPLE